ncbi:MAG: hypothetical protein ACXVWW_05210, partial [Nocardioides sp.]
MNLRASALALATVATTITVVGGSVGPATAATDTGKGCNYHTYGQRYSVSVASATPVLTRLASFTLPPGANQGTVVTLRTQARLRSSVTTSGSVTAATSGVAAKVLGKASATVGYSLSASGAVSTAKSVTRKWDIPNRTLRNQRYVAYNGFTKVTGSWVHTYCEQLHSYSGWTVFRETGSYRSWGNPQLPSYLQCGAGGPGALDRL